MPTDRVNDLAAFRAFIDEKLSGDGANLSVDEALALWEIENQTDQERGETLEAIREGFADLEAGRTVDAFEFVQRMRGTIQSFAKP